jgi:pimeloyl-ACP methyl ester carboxylesterase
MTAIVLVHGANHGPWCWTKVDAPLRARGLRVETPDLYSQPNASDPGAVQAAVDQCADDAPVIVLGHSFGGYAITQLDPATISHLVYLAAIVPTPSQDESLGNPVVPDFWDKMATADGIMTARPERLRDMWYGDCTDDDVEFCAARLRPHPMGAVPSAVPDAAWLHVPTTYVICEHDGTITLDYMRAASALVGDCVSWPTSHSPFFSRPELVVNLLLDIADGRHLAR